MTSVLVGIIVVIGLFYLLIVIYQHYILKNSSQVLSDFDKIKSIPIDGEIESADKLNLTGGSLEQFNSYKEQYEDIKKENFEEIQAQVEIIQQESRSLNFFKTQRTHHDLGKMVDETGALVKEIQAGLAQLQDLEKQHQKSLVDLREKYKKMRKTLLAKNYLYGPSGKKLDKVLAEDEKIFHKFSKLTKEGDHDSAEQVLQELNTKTSSLSQMIEQIPPLYKNFTTEFRNQVEEIKNGHAQMIESGYNFPDDNFEKNIQYIDKQIDKSLSLLKNLEIDKVRNGNHQVNMMIEQLYDQMENELNAKHSVEKNLNIINAYIEHARQQNEALSEELAHLSQNYDLNHHEIEDTRQLKEQIKTIKNINRRDLHDIHEEEAVYSIVQAHQDKAKHDLSQIEAQQRDINDSVSDLNHEEDAARETIQKYDLKLHNMNRQIENLNLPGIPANYLDAYDLVDNEISELFQSMNQEKISMDNINDRLELIQHHVDDLDERTNSLVDNAVLAENLLQYSNRYRNRYPQMELAINKAMKLFSEDYNYEESLAVISAELEQIDPGAFKRIEQNYNMNSDDQQ